VKFNLKSVLLFSTPFLLVLVLSYFLQYKIIDNEKEITAWLSQFGVYVVIVYVVLQALTIIIAPIGGFFLVVAMMSLYGAERTLALAYVVASSTYVINFLLARRYGRPFVQRIVGKSSLKKVDHLVKDAGFIILIMTRILQSSNFDYISYGWGLTKIPFNTFVWVNFLAGIPGTLVTYFIITSFDNLIFGLIAFYLSTAIFAGIAIYLTHYLKKHKKN